MNDTLINRSVEQDRRDVENLRLAISDLGELLRAATVALHNREAGIQSEPVYCAACGAEARVTVDGYGLFCAKCLESES
jgi:hypothetical protein